MLASIMFYTHIYISSIRYCKIDIVWKYALSKFVLFVECCATIIHTFLITDIFGPTPRVRVELNSIAQVCVETLAYFVANTNVCLI